MSPDKHAMTGKCISYSPADQGTFTLEAFVPSKADRCA